MRSLRNRFIAIAVLVGVVFAVWEIRAQTSQSVDSILAVARDYMAKQFEGNEGEYRISLLPLDPRLQLAECARPLEAFSSGAHGGSGDVSVGIRCAAPKSWTIYVKAKVEVFRSVVVLRRPARRGVALTRDDLDLRREDVAKLRNGFLAQTEDAEGMMVTKDLPPGAVLTANVLAQPKAIHKGQRVAVVAGKHGFAVNVMGVALQDGGLGQRIRVRNEQSGRIIEGVVLDSGTIQVE